jgi:hypothetical protein
MSLDQKRGTPTIDWHEQLIEYANAVIRTNNTYRSEEDRQNSKSKAKELRSQSPNLDCVLSCLEKFGTDESLHTIGA